MKKIPILDLNPEIEELRPSIMAVIDKVLQSGTFIGGQYVEEFEHRCQAYLETKNAIGVNSGTDALLIALKALGVGQGDEVITSAFTFFATAEAIHHTGATPVFVDIDSDTFNINCSLIAEKLTTRTKAIIPVHMFGHAADMSEIMQIAEQRQLFVIEDNAQAFSGTYLGRKLGSIGDFGAHSFFPSKNLGAFGDGGLLTTNDDTLAEKARMLRAHGAKKKYFNEILGYNSRLDALQAAILQVKLHHLDKSTEGRRAAAQRYRELLGSTSGIKLPIEWSNTKHVYHQYTIRIEGGRRDQVKSYLAEKGISTMIYYPLPVPKLPFYSDSQPPCLEAERASAEVLSLPIWPSIPMETQEYVARNVRDALRSIRP